MKRFIATSLALILLIQAPLTAFATVTTLQPTTRVIKPIKPVVVPSVVLQPLKQLEEQPTLTKLESINIDELLIPFENPTSLKTALQAGEPSSSEGYAENDGVLIDWNSPSLKWWFQWDSSLENIDRLQWQVATMPFVNDPSKWKTPPGLVGSGALNPTDAAFAIDFGAFNQTATQWSKEYTQIQAIPYIQKVLVTNKKTLATAKNTPTFNKIVNKPIVSSLNVGGVTAIRNIKNPQVQLLKAQEQSKNMATMMNTAKARKYYIRVVPLDAQGQCLSSPSMQREVVFGQIPPKAPDVLLTTTLTGEKASEVMPYAETGKVYVDWNTSLPYCYFKTTIPKEVLEGQIQVSTKPFTSGPDADWANPDGLVFQENLDAVQTGFTYATIKQELTSFAPKKANRGKSLFHYYVRTIFTKDSDDKALLVSNTIDMFYGQLSTQDIQIYDKVKIPIYKPLISVKSYTPIHSETAKWNFMYVVVKEPPAMFKGMYHLGQKVDLSPRPENKSTWDYIADGIGSAIGFAESLLNWASSTMNSLENFAANMIVAFVPGQPEWLKSIVIAGIQSGLVSLGIPPSLPTSDQLMNLGVDYLAQTVAEQAGVPSGITSEIAKKGVQAMADKAKTTGSIGGVMDFLKLDPDYQYRNAYMLLDLYNPDPKNATLAGAIGVEVKDITPAFKEKHYLYGSNVYKTINMPIPALAPGQHLQVPVIFEENTGSTSDTVDAAEAWTPYYKEGTSSFNIRFYSPLPDAKELAKQYGISSTMLEFQDVNGQPVTIEQRPNQAR